MHVECDSSLSSSSSSSGTNEYSSSSSLIPGRHSCSSDSEAQLPVVLKKDAFAGERRDDRRIIFMGEAATRKEFRLQAREFKFKSDYRYMTVYHCGGEKSLLHDKKRCASLLVARVPDFF